MKILIIFLFLQLTIISHQKEENPDSQTYDDLKKEVNDMLKEISEEEENNNSEKNKTIPIDPLPTEEIPIDDEDTKEPKIEYENLPQAKILLPIRRFGTSNTILNSSPCGGIERQLSNTITRKGSYINFVWEVVKPEINGTCSVKISAGLENETLFETLHPTSGQSNLNGEFECGRTKGFENREFKLPENYECDGCILQWKWKTNYGNIYSCSDIIIDGKKLDSCRAQCLNGGTCFNGVCLCPNGFSGEFCEQEGDEGSGWWKLLAILGGTGIVGVGGYFLYNNKFTQDWITSYKMNNNALPGSLSRNQDLDDDFHEGSNRQSGAIPPNNDYP